MVEIRNVPTSLHRTLKWRAASAGMSLSDYLPAEMRMLAERPAVEEMRARLAERSSPTLSMSAADAVRAERDRD